MPVVQITRQAYQELKLLQALALSFRVSTRTNGDLLLAFHYSCAGKSARSQNYHSGVLISEVRLSYLPGMSHPANASVVVRMK